jgi:hypothetical protein
MHAPHNNTWRFGQQELANIFAIGYATAVVPDEKLFDAFVLGRCCQTSS